MNTELLLALGLGLGGAVLLAVLLLRRRGTAPRPAQPPAPGLEAAPPAPPAQASPQGVPVAQPVDHLPAGLLDAQRQATTEALRLARQRKAEEAARLEAARAEAEALAAEQLAAQRLAAEKQAAQRMAVEREAAQRQAQARLEAERRDAERRAAERRAAVPDVAAAPVRPAAPAAPVTPVTPHVPLILVADDSKVVRVKTGRLLEKQGWQVLLAEDGAAALALLDSHRPDLLVTDVEMPGLDGFALTRRVRAHARGARLPVVMITSSDDRHRADASAAGVDLLLGKPYEEDALLGHLRRLLKLPAAQAEAALH